MVYFEHKTTSTHCHYSVTDMIEVDMMLPEEKGEASQDIACGV